jgi:hypothetical protein
MLWGKRNSSVHPANSNDWQNSDLETNLMELNHLARGSGFQLHKTLRTHIVQGSCRTFSEDPADDINESLSDVPLGDGQSEHMKELQHRLTDRLGQSVCQDH